MPGPQYVARANRTAALASNRHVGGPGASRTEGEPVGSHAVPFLNQESEGFEELADFRALPSRTFFQNRPQDENCVIAQHCSPGDMRYMLGFRNGDGEAVAGVDVEHDVDIGISVAGVNDVVRADLEI